MPPIEFTQHTKKLRIHRRKPMGWLSEIWNKLKSLAATVWNDICNTYQRTKVYLLALLAIVVVWEWRKLKAAFLVKMGQKQIDSANKQDKVLAQAEQTENAEADALVKKAQNEPNP